MTPWFWIERLWQDLRHGLRVFGKHPGFTAIAVMSIAFGTGANVAMFSATDALLLRPLPVLRPSELLVVGSKVHSGLMTMSVASFADYVDIRARTSSFSGLIASSIWRAGFSPDASAAPKVKVAALVSGNFFRVLGVPPQLGRDFNDSEDEVPGRDAVAVLSHGMWQTEFAGDPAVLGRTIRLAGKPFTVIGVAPEQFTGLDERYFPEVAYVPLAMSREFMSDPAIDPLTARDFRPFQLKGRLTAGVTLAQARAELSAIGEDLARLHPDTNTDRALSIETELETRIERGPIEAGLLTLLSLLSIAVLGVACANVAGLLASRAPVRAREMALRLAIGASRARLVRQLITESMGIAIAGGLSGIVVGQAGIMLLRQLQLPTDLVALPVMHLDGRVLLVSVGVAMSSAFLFGLVPALQMSRVSLTSVLKATEPGATGRRPLTGRSVLVALQVALSLVLLTVAMFAFEVFRHAFSEGPGFRTAHLAKLSLDPTQARYTEDQAQRFFESVAADARRVPGIVSVGLASSMPLFGFDVVSVVPEGHEAGVGTAGAQLYANSIDEGYFDAMDIAIVAGRPFRATDDANGVGVAIVNEMFAAHYWPSGLGVGKRFRLNDDDQAPWIEIVGVARTSKILYFAEPPHEAVYFPFRQRPRGNMIVLAATAAESGEALEPLRAVVEGLDANVPVYDVQTIETFYEARATGIGNVVIRLIAWMGIMGVTLTTVGLYGLVSYSVGRRTREIGIRVAIGATRGRILAMILRQGMTPACIGLTIGFVLSMTTTRLLPALIPVAYSYRSSAILFMVPLLFVITLLAGFIPARRAARLAPTVALRYE